MSTPRHEVSAVRLADGRVLVAGGVNAANTVLSSAEIFDPSSRTWHGTGSMTTPRLAASTTLLADGRVLVAGGVSGSTVYSSAELFDPATGTWAATGSMHQARDGESAVLLPDGDVLVVGGWPDTADSYGLASAEIYHPSSGTWTVAASTAIGATGRSISLLADGRVMLAGGLTCCGYASLADTEIYTPATNTWATVMPLHTPRNLGQLDPGVTLPTGQVVMPGGDTSGIANPTVSVEAFDPGAKTWSNLASLHHARVSPGLALAGSRFVLVAGGDLGCCTPVVLDSAEVYDPATNTWTLTPPMPYGVTWATATRLADGQCVDRRRC